MTEDPLQAFIFSHKKKWESEDTCFTINKKQLEENLEDIKKKLPGEIAYSYKTNPDIQIAEIVKASGTGFLLSSCEEASILIDALNIQPEKLIFQSPSLTKEQLEKLIQLGISRISIDSLEQLETVLSSLDKMVRLPELLIRINTGVKINKEPELNYSTDSYLGFPLDEAMEAISKLSPLRKKGEIKLGIHNHLLSQNTFIDAWKENHDVMVDFLSKLKDADIQIDSVDFGGGIPVDYGKKIPSFEEISEVVNDTTIRMTEIFPDLNFIFEPGRKTVAESVTLLSKVVHVKEFRGHKVAILNCSVYNAGMDAILVDLYLQAFKIEGNTGPKSNYILRGSTPDSMDIFSYDTELEEVAEDDILAFKHAGAYAFGSDFISLKKPPHILI